MQKSNWILKSKKRTDFGLQYCTVKSQLLWILVHHEIENIPVQRAFFSSFDAPKSEWSSVNLFCEETQNPFWIAESGLGFSLRIAPLCFYKLFSLLARLQNGFDLIVTKKPFLGSVNKVCIVIQCNVLHCIALYCIVFEFVTCAHSLTQSGACVHRRAPTVSVVFWACACKLSGRLLAL